MMDSVFAEEVDDLVNAEGGEILEAAVDEELRGRLDGGGFSELFFSRAHLITSPPGTARVRVG